MYLIFIAFLIICINYLIIKNKNSFNNNLISKSAHSIHSDAVPRIGGVSIYIFLIILSIPNFIIDNLFSEFIFKLFIISLPIFFIGLIEDVNNNIRPIYRLFASIISSVIFIYYFGELGFIDFFGISFFENNVFFLTFLTIVAISSIIHSYNITDGLNGLAIFNYISVCSALIIFYFFEIYSWNAIALIFITIPILFFNYPYGKLFLGDSGSYTLGVIASSLTIIFFNSINLFTWLAILLLIYPITETLLTFFRRLASSTKVFDPDNKHMHSLIFLHTNKKLPEKNSLDINNISSLKMIPFITFGPIMFGIAIKNNFNQIGILLLIFVYLIFYLAIYYRLLKKLT